MRYFFVFIFLLPLISLSQNDSIEILLKSDSTIYTNWIELNDFTFLKKPYIKIHDLDGPKIKISQIKYYKGFDKNGNYKNLKTIDLGSKNKYSFVERSFKHESIKRIDIYYDRLIFGGLDIPSSFKYLNYKKDNQTIKKVTYKNLLHDLSDNAISLNYLKKAKQIKLIQIISTGLGAFLIFKVMLDNYRPSPYNVKSNSKDDFSFYVGSFFLIIPFFLEKPKNKRFIQALKSYE